MYNTINTKLESVKSSRLRDMYKFEKESSSPEDMKIGTMNSYVVTSDKIFIEEGFNIRELNEDHVQNFKNAYLENKTVPSIMVKVVLNEVTNEYICVVREGHHRFAGGTLAGKTEYEVVEFTGDEVDEIMLMIDTANGLPLNQLDMANAVARLRETGLNNSEIGRKIKKSSAHVGHLFDLLNMPHKLKELVRNNQIAATYARELYKEHGDNVMKVIASISNSDKNATDAPKEASEQAVEPLQKQDVVVEKVGSENGFTNANSSSINEHQNNEVDKKDHRLSQGYEEIQAVLDIDENIEEIIKVESKLDDDQIAQVCPKLRVTKKKVVNDKSIPKSIHPELRAFILKICSQLDEDADENLFKIDDEDYLQLKHFEEILEK